MSAADPDGSAIEDGVAIEIVSWGIAGSVQDAGRRGLAHLGRSRGGAVDAAALALGNRIVGNPPGTAGIETSGGSMLIARRPVLVAITGSPCDVAVIDGPPIGWGTAAVLPAGARLRIGRLHGGARTYVAVRGGLVRSWVPADGSPEVLAVGLDPGTRVAHEPVPPRHADGPVRLWPGPRQDWFVPEAWHLLVSSTWTVRAESDRIGARLDGSRLDRAVTRELASEGLVEGAVQVPPDGRPIVMLCDHPVTGGYPVVAVVDPADIGLVAQAPIGGALRFRAAGTRRTG